MVQGVGATCSGVIESHKNTGSELNKPLRMKTKTIILFVANKLELTGQQRARAIVARFIREGRIHELPWGGRNNIRVDEEMRDCLEQIINENCALTLVQINRELRRCLPHKPEIHERTYTEWDVVRT